MSQIKGDGCAQCSTHCCVFLWLRTVLLHTVVCCCGCAQCSAATYCCVLWLHTVFCYILLCIVVAAHSVLLHTVVYCGCAHCSAATYCAHSVLLHTVVYCCGCTQCSATYCCVLWLRTLFCCYILLCVVAVPSMMPTARSTMPMATVTMAATTKSVTGTVWTANSNSRRWRRACCILWC